MKDFDKKARESLEESFYTFSIYSPDEQVKLIAAWQIGYAEAKKEMLLKLKETIYVER